MFIKQFDAITKDDILALVTNQTPESRILDYKQALPGRTDGDKKEFLADVSSFANSAGGWLVYGVEEKRENNKATGLPETASGLDGANGEQERQRLESILQYGVEPRIAGVRIRSISGFPKGPAILLYVPKSWNSPHMVSFQESSKFWTRSDGRKRQLDLGEIRAAFALSETLPEKIRRFRDDRIAKILADETPIPLQGKHRVVLHLIPFSSMAFSAAVDLELAAKNSSNLPPIGSTGYASCRHNFDGLVAQDYEDYLQLFRNGAIEAVNSSLLTVQDIIPASAFESNVFGAVDRYLKLQHDLAVSPPIVLLLTLIGVNGYVTETQQGSMMRGLGTIKGAIDRDILALPDMMIEDMARPADEILRPAFDIIWQACGFKCCPNYDNGHWKRFGS